MSDWIMARLDALRERVERATPGPWENYGDGDHEVYQAVEYDDGDVGPYIARFVPAEDDAVFIAAARTDVPRMEAALRAVLELHKKAPIYDVMADDCLDHDYEMYGLELSMGDEVCSHQSHVDSYTCDECAGIAHNNLDGELPEWPCPTVRAVAGVLRLERDDDE